MRGFPKWLNTRQDLINCLELYPERADEAARNLLAGRFVWVATGAVPDGEAGIEDAMHRVVESVDDSGQTIHTQLELQDDPQARLYRLGFTAAELEGML